jgi:hypothetical protein
MSPWKKQVGLAIVPLVKLSEERFVRKSNRQAVIKKFNGLDIHDDDLVSVNVHPPRSRRNSALIEFEFQDDSTGKRQLVSFRGCANVRYLMDFDVLTDNSFAQTDRASSFGDVGRMAKLIRSQMAHWHTQYMPSCPKDQPIRKKLASLDKYVLFRITFFGGIVEILAKNFVLSRSRNHVSRPGAPIRKR